MTFQFISFVKRILFKKRISHIHWKSTESEVRITSQIKECTENAVNDKDLKKITESYKRMNHANRCFLVSASSMLLASQGKEEQEADKEKEVI